MPFPFLELPTELRFHVYAIITIPRDAPFSAYSGVYLSCKQIKAEIDQEGAKATKSYLAYLTSIIPNIAISSTKSPASLSNLHLTLSPVFYATLTSVPSMLILRPFLCLYTTSLRISFIPRAGEEDVVWGAAQSVRKVAMLKRIFYGNADEIRARQVVMIHPMMTTSMAKYCARMFSDMFKEWGCSWHWEEVDGDTSILVGIWKWEVAW
jgi:hypothetical protein